MNARTLLAGAGCGVLLTLSLTIRLLADHHLAVYPQVFPLNTVFLAVLIDMLGFSLIAAFAWAAVERLRRSSPLWPALLAGVILLESYGIAKLLVWEISRQVWTGFFVGVMILGFGLRWWRRAGFEWAIRASGVSLAVCGFSIFWMAPELVYLAVQTSGHETPGFSHSPSLSSEPGPRIVWILFDELSYNQVYEHRWGGLELPNFDRLRAESMTFSNVEPANYETRIAIPSMFLGRPASQIRSSPQGEPAFFMDDRQDWENFDASRSIFGEARRLGWTSAVMGFYNPYCRFLKDWVDACYWLGGDGPIVPFQPNLDPHQGTFENAVYPAKRWLHTLMPAVVPERERSSSDPQHNYEVAMEHARTLIRDSAIRFQFIHLPVPHPPAIYDRKTHTFSTHGSYLDNLVLADITLGELLDTLERGPNWQDTTLVVCGDHSWRLPLWKHSPWWVAEDEAASKGVFDSRPVLQVHLPGEREGTSVTGKFQGRNISHVLDAVMRGWIRRPEDVVMQMEPRLSTQLTPLHP